MKTIYKAIQDRITEKVPVMLVDLDYGQADNFELRPNLKPPTVLIKISDTPKNVSEDGAMQLHTASVSVRSVFMPHVRRTGSNAPEEAQNKSLEYLDTADAVYLALQGFETDELSAIECSSIAQETRNDGLIVIAFTLSTSYYDYRPDEQA